MLDDECAYRDYVMNLIAVWDQEPDSAPTMVSHFFQLDKAVDRLREVLERDSEAHLPLNAGGFRRRQL